MILFMDPIIGVQVDYEEWRSRRNNDFLQFFSMLKEMPTETGK